MEFERCKLCHGTAVSICDSKDNEIFQADIDREGNIKNILVYEYDDSGRAMAWMILDANGNLQRSFKSSYKYGEETAIEEFGAKGGLIRKTEFERDLSGSITKEIYYNAENEIKGYGVYVYRDGEYEHTVYYDCNGNVVDKPVA